MGKLCTETDLGLSRRRRQTVEYISVDPTYVVVLGWIVL
jgi:hypothetical protein